MNSYTYDENIHPILVRYRYPISGILSLSKRFKNKLTIINTGEPVECQDSNVVVVNFNNSYREVGGYLKGIALLNMDEDSCALLFNDTVFGNKNLWKISVVIRSMMDKKFSAPCLYGLSDRSFNVHTNKWYGAPGWHIRSDIFGLNYNGIKLLDGHISSEDVYNKFNEDIFFKELLQDFVSNYHVTKKNQMKEFATFFEVFLSHYFRENGLISCSLDGRKNLLTKFLLNAVSATRRRLHV